MATSSDYTKWLKDNGIPSIDAVQELPVVITKHDTKRSEPGNSNCCVIANKLDKGVGIKAVNIFLRVAHILLKDPSQEGYINVRYTIDAKTRAAIKKFDKRQPFPPDTYVLRPVHRGNTKAVKKVTDAKRTKRSGKGNGTQAPKMKMHVRRFNHALPKVGITAAAQAN